MWELTSRYRFSTATVLVSSVWAIHDVLHASPAPLTAALTIGWAGLGIVVALAAFAYVHLVGEEGAAITNASSTETATLPDTYIPPRSKRTARIVWAGAILVALLAVASLCSEYVAYQAWKADCCTVGPLAFPTVQLWFLHITAMIGVAFFPFHLERADLRFGEHLGAILAGAFTFAIVYSGAPALYPTLAVGHVHPITRDAVAQPHDFGTHEWRFTSKDTDAILVRVERGVLGPVLVTTDGVIGLAGPNGLVAWEYRIHGALAEVDTRYAGKVIVRYPHHPEFNRVISTLRGSGTRPPSPGEAPEAHPFDSPYSGVLTAQPGKHSTCVAKDGEPYTPRAGMAQYLAPGYLCLGGSVKERQAAAERQSQWTAEITDPNWMVTDVWHPDVTIPAAPDGVFLTATPGAMVFAVRSYEKIPASWKNDGSYHWEVIGRVK